MSNIRYVSGDFSTAVAVSDAHSESPLLPELNDVLVITQDFMQHQAAFAPLPYNSAITTVFGTAHIFDETPREDIGGLICRWTRRYAIVPPSYGMAGGIYSFIFPGGPSGRNPFRLPVAMEIQRDFFLCGDGGVYSSWQDIPVNPAFTVLSDADDSTSIVAPSLDPAAGYTLSDAAGSDPGTSPSLTGYNASISGGAQIQPEDDKVTCWRGGIYMRERYLILAR